ncbi:phage tail tape measure protein [Gallibacterium sp. ZY190522]
MANMKLGIEITAQDNASKVVKTVGDNVAKTTKATEQQTVKSGKKMEDSYLKAARTFEQSYNKRKQAYRTMESYGLRSERAIQAEINRTRESYNRLRNSGVMSSRELARATEAHRRKIAELNAEMGKTSFGQKMGAVGGAMMQVGAGVMAGAMVMREPVQKAMTYDRQLAMTANTAFSDRDVAGRIAGKKELHAAVKQAVETGGGTKEEALGALDTLLASGAVKTDTAMALLPTLQKAAVATGASTDDIAKIMISSMQQMGISEDQIGAVLDKAVAAGQAGNFELADMARWLPQQMAAAKAAGLSGMSGFEALLVANQQARVTAGTSDEAGNNLVNLLAKITSKETNDRFKNLDYVDPKTGKKVGIDFVGSMANYKKSGMNSLEAFSQIINDVVGNDKQYQALQAKLKTAKKEDQHRILDEMAKLVEGTAIGQVISDRQALMALIGIRNNAELGKEVQQQISNAQGAVNTSHKVVADTADYKVNDLKNTQEFAQLNNLSGFNTTLGEVSQTLSKYGKKYPELTNFVVGATDAVKAFGMALGAISLLDLFKKKGGGIESIFRRTTTTVGTATTAGAATTVGTTLSRAGTGLLSKAKGVVSVPTLALTGLAIGAENATSYFAQKEAKDEQQADSKKQFYQALSQQTAPKTNYWAGYQPPTTTTAQSPKTQNAMALAYGGATMAFDNEVAAERVKQGTLSEADYQARVNRNASRMERWRNAATNTPYQGLKNIDMTNAGNPLQQAKRSNQTDKIDLVGEIQSMGQTLSETLKRILDNQSYTLKNLITVELDGRQIAEAVSEKQYQHFVRG